MGWTAILIVIIGFPLWGAAFALSGTTLPATVAGVDASFKTSWKRAKGHFWYTILRLACGPFLFEIVLIGLVVTAGMSGLPVTVFKESGAFSPIGTLVSTFVMFASLFGTALLAAVLCKTFFRSEATSVV